jgi:hypothetical protein
MDTPFGSPFDVKNFPDLYPPTLQDEVNESYNHDKVLPKQEGKDYIETELNKKEEALENAAGYQE